MALPKENPADENNELEGFVSQPDESAAHAATQLEPLLNLLVDLKIIAGSNQQNAEPEGDSSENDRAGDLGGLMDLLGISSEKQEEVAASVPETGDRKPESGDSPAVADNLISLLFATHKLNTSELEKNYSSAKTIEVSALVQPDLEEESQACRRIV